MRQHGPREFAWYRLRMQTLECAARMVDECAALSTEELCARISRLCEAERLAEWAGCKLLAELADRFDRLLARGWWRHRFSYS